MTTARVEPINFKWLKQDLNIWTFLLLINLLDLPKSQLPVSLAIISHLMSQVIYKNTTCEDTHLVNDFQKSSTDTFSFDKTVLKGEYISVKRSSWIYLERVFLTSFLEIESLSFCKHISALPRSVMESTVWRNLLPGITRSNKSFIVWYEGVKVWRQKGSSKCYWILKQIEPFSIYILNCNLLF